TNAELSLHGIAGARLPAVLSQHPGAMPTMSYRGKPVAPHRWPMPCCYVRTITTPSTPVCGQYNLLTALPGLLRHPILIQTVGHVATGFGAETSAYNVYPPISYVLS